MKRKYFIGAIPAALLLAAVLYVYGGGRAPSGQPPLRNVTAQTAGEIRNEFNAAKDEPRVLLLLSPT
jgi:hypothetical protein